MEKLSNVMGYEPVSGSGIYDFIRTSIGILLNLTGPFLKIWLNLEWIWIWCERIQIKTSVTGGL